MVENLRSAFLSLLVLDLLLFPSREGGAWVLSSECKIDQTDFTNWMFFLPSHFMKEISRTQKSKAKVFYQHEIAIMLEYSHLTIIVITIKYQIYRKHLSLTIYKMNLF